MAVDNNDDFQQTLLRTMKVFDGELGSHCDQYDNYECRQRRCWTLHFVQITVFRFTQTMLVAGDSCRGQKIYTCWDITCGGQRYKIDILYTFRRPYLLRVETENKNQSGF